MPSPSSQFPPTDGEWRDLLFTLEAFKLLDYDVYDSRQLKPVENVMGRPGCLRW